MEDRFRIVFVDLRRPGHARVLVSGLDHATAVNAIDDLRRNRPVGDAIVHAAQRER